VVGPRKLLNDLTMGLQSVILKGCRQIWRFSNVIFGSLTIDVSNECGSADPMIRLV